MLVFDRTDSEQQSGLAMYVAEEDEEGRQEGGKKRKNGRVRDKASQNRSANSHPH